MRYSIYRMDINDNGRILPYLLAGFNDANDAARYAYDYAFGHGTNVLLSAPDGFRIVAPFA